MFLGAVAQKPANGMSSRAFEERVHLIYCKKAYQINLHEMEVYG